MSPVSVALGNVFYALTWNWPTVERMVDSCRCFCALIRKIDMYTVCILHFSFTFAKPNRGGGGGRGRWGTTDDFTTSFLHFSLFSTALSDLANSRLVHSLMLPSHLFFCLPCFLPPFTVPCKMVLARPDERETCP